MRHRSWHTGKTTGRAPLNRVQILHDRVGIFVGVTQATQLAHDKLALKIKKYRDSPAQPENLGATMSPESQKSAYL